MRQGQDVITEDALDIPPVIRKVVNDGMERRYLIEALSQAAAALDDAAHDIGVWGNRTNKQERKDNGLDEDIANYRTKAAELRKLIDESATTTD